MAERVRISTQLTRQERQLRAALQGDYQMRRPWGIFGRRPLVDGGHQDWGAFALNTGVDLTQENKLGELHRVGQTENMQPVQADVPSLRRSGFKLIVGAEFVAPVGSEDFVPPTTEGFLEEQAKHDKVYADVVASHRSISLVTTVEDLLENVINKRDGIGIIKSVEGLYVNPDNYRDVIDALKERGVRSVGLMWNFDTEVGCTTAVAVRNAEGAKQDTGLSDFGRQVVRYMDERDMIVDLSHASDKTIQGVLEELRFNPPVATHSGSREVHEHNRNLTIDNAFEIIRRGGIVGIPFVGPFIGKEGERNIDRVVEHLGHLKYMNLLHGVVLGSDFNGMGDKSVISGLEDITVVRRNLTRAMRRAGFTRQEINQVFHQNATDFWLKNLPSRRERQGEQVVFPTRIK